MKCDVLYIHPTQRPDNTNYGIMPMGVIALLNEIEKSGFSVYGINIAIEKYVDKKFSIYEKLKRVQYRVLLVDLHWYEHSYSAIEIARISKEIYPDIPVILGGYTSTIYAEEIMRQFKYIDYIVEGDSDYPLPELVRTLLSRKEMPNIISIPNIWFRSSNHENVLRTEKIWRQNSLDALDFVNIKMFNNSKYIPFLTTEKVNKIAPSYWLCIARGCIYDCSYCCGGHHNMERLFHRKTMLTRSPKKVCEDILSLTKMGIQYVCFSHDLMMLGEEYYKELFEKIRRTGIKPGMYLECFQLPSEKFIDEVLKTFERQNIILVISPISGNEELRRKNGKYFSNIQFLKILDYIKEHNIKLQLYYTQNLYRETKKEFMDTYEQIKYIRTELGLSRKCIYYQAIVIDPLAKMRSEENIKVSYNTFMDYYNYCFDEKSGFGWKDDGEISMSEKERMINIART